MALDKIPQIIIAASAGTETDTNSGGLLSPDVGMVILTWLTFFILAGILYKFAWKPILEGLDRREAAIEKSIEQAEEIQRRFEQLEESAAQMIAEAEQKAKNIIQESRKASQTAAKVIEQKAREEAQIIFENNQREIKAQISRTAAELRKQSAELVIAVAEKLLKDSMNDSKSRKLVEKCLEEIG